MTRARGANSRENTFTPADLKLFHESPFASWMEQLDRVHPDHGIVADLSVAFGGAGTEGRASPVQNRQFLQQLIENGNRVVSIDLAGSVAERQQQTLQAMRENANFIFYPYLSVLPLAGSIDFILRTPGDSVLGEFHYTPAEFYYGQAGPAGLPVELCCYVDMLEHIQGVRPEEVLRVSADTTQPHIERLPANDFMFDYRKLKIRFRQSQLAFDREDMPDPADSQHWGRWSRYGRQVVARRARDV